MARAIRFVKAERDLIRWHAQTIVSCPLGIPASKVKAAEGIINKLSEAEAPQVKSRNYLSVQDAIKVFQSVLDRRLIIPPNGASLVYIRMQQQLKSLGLTKEQCATAATEAGKQWQGNIKAQSILNQAEMLLQSASEPPLLNEWDSLSGEDVSSDVMSDL